MDSINKNQPEENTKNLFGEEAITKIKELVGKSGVCFFCTKIKSGESFSTRPMSVQITDDDGNMFFLSAADSHHNVEINEDSKVQLLFKESSYEDFLTLYGEASINKDRAMIEKLWNPMMKTWFTEGIDDPRITVIKFAIKDGYYWDTKHGQLVSFIKRLAGAAMGKTLDDSIEGYIKV